MSDTMNAVAGLLRVDPNPQPVEEARREEILAAPGFGLHFTDHMVLIEWTPGRGWHDGRVQPYGSLSLDPATAVLHYAQEIFEGMKAYRHGDGSVWTFRPEFNAARFQRSSWRMALPQLPTDVFVEAVDALVRTDAAWVPGGAETSLYVRPFMYASEVFLGVRPAEHATFCVIASPAGPYFPGDLKPVSIWLSQDYTRAARGGTGAAKCGGNYAASLIAQQQATDHGCAQVAFLDAVERRYVEELGGMNLFLVRTDGSIVTPELGDSVLDGVTRDSLISLLGDLGHKVEERRVEVAEWREGVAAGEVSEVFACGTAAVVTPVGVLKWDGGQADSAAPHGGAAGPVTSAVRAALVDVQYGRAADDRGWLHRVR